MTILQAKLSQWQVLYVWRWDPKDDNCTGGKRGTHVGFPFDIGTAHCVVWVTTEEALLECLNNGRRTVVTSNSRDLERYGQWSITKPASNNFKLVIGLAVGAAVLAIAVVAIAVLILILVLLKKRRKKRYQAPPPPPPLLPSPPPFPPSQP